MSQGFPQPGRQIWETVSVQARMGILEAVTVGLDGGLAPFGSDCVQQAEGPGEVSTIGASAPPPEIYDRGVG